MHRTMSRRRRNSLDGSGKRPPQAELAANSKTGAERCSVDALQKAHNELKLMHTDKHYLCVHAFAYHFDRAPFTS